MKRKFVTVSKYQEYQGYQRDTIALPKSDGSHRTVHVPRRSDYYVINGNQYINALNESTVAGESKIRAVSVTLRHRIDNYKIHVDFIINSEAEMYLGRVVARYYPYSCWVFVESYTINRKFRRDCEKAQAKKNKLNEQKVYAKRRDARFAVV